MKKIYKVWVRQTFNAYETEDSGKWYKPDKVVEVVRYVDKFEELIFSDSIESAINEYKSRYVWDIKDRCLDNWLGAFSSYPRVNSKNPNYQCEVRCMEDNLFTFNELKDKLSAGDFVEYCKQELYPIEVIMSDDK